jgi:hypothetical protein
MDDNSATFKTFIDAHSDFLIAKGFAQKRFKASSLVSEYIFHSDAIGVKFNAEWRDMCPDISIVRIGKLVDLDSFRFNKDKVTVCLRLPEVLTILKLSSRDFYKPTSTNDILDLALNQIRLLESHIDSIIINLDFIFSTAEGQKR